MKEHIKVYKRIENKDSVMYVIGKICQEYRINVLKETQKEIAEKLGFSSAMNISLFENGKVDSAYILQYYIRRGLDL